MDAFTQPLSCWFSDFLLDRQSRALYRVNTSGERIAVSIGSRAFEILCLLIDRGGEFVSRHEILSAVWQNAVVEESNLTVQMAALRRALDAGHQCESCIQTVPGRGYRFALPVSRSPQPQADPALAAPRLSIVVMPFENLSGDPADDCLAEVITDDLTTDLTFIPDVLVTVRESANAYRGQHWEVPAIGGDLRVRYILKGNMRRVGAKLHINVQLISTETSAVLWSDRFDEEIGAAAEKLDNIVSRVKDQLDVRLIDVESARSLRERPTNPDAFDLALHARRIIYQPPSLQRDAEVLSLLDRALALDPRSVYAMTYIAFHLISGTSVGRAQPSTASRRFGLLAGLLVPGRPRGMGGERSAGDELRCAAVVAGSKKPAYEALSSAETLAEETTVAIDGELYEIDFLRPIKPGAEVFFIPRIEGG
jgi:TolB-like protein